MDEDTLPQIPHDNSEETVMSDPQRTRPTDTLPKTVETSQHIPPVQKPPHPKGGHVQPMPGQKSKQGTTLRYGRRPPAQKTQAKDSSLYLPWWSLALMLIGVMIVSFGVVGAIFLLGNKGGFLAEPTPIVRIITAVPTNAPLSVQPTAALPSTQIIVGGSAPTDLQLQGPTLEAVQFTPTPLPITINQRVVVEGVEDQKLNVRDVATITQSTVLFRADEGELFVVVEGPVQADGFTWWRIQDPTNPARAGWAVSNYLAVAPSQ